MCLGGLLAYIHIWASFPWRIEEGLESSVTGVMYSCEPPCGRWETKGFSARIASLLYH